MTYVTKTLNLATVGREIRLELDDQQFTQGLMLRHFAQGQPYEPTLTQFVIRVLKAGDGVIEVGAHVGYVSTITAGLVGPTGKVVAVEANAGNFDRLSHHKRINGLDQLEPVHAAASDREGTVTFHVNADNDGGHALWDPGLHGFNKQSRVAPKSVTVPAVTVDGLKARLGERRLRFMKIDTEGAEVMVLAGARETLAAAQDLLIVAELNEFGLQAMGTDQNRLRGMMAELGYASFRMPVNGDVPAWIPPRSRAHNARNVENLLFARPDTISELWPVIEI